MDGVKETRNLNPTKPQTLKPSQSWGLRSSGPALKASGSQIKTQNHRFFRMGSGSYRLVRPTPSDRRRRVCVAWGVGVLGASFGVASWPSRELGDFERFVVIYEP